jgi:hypothetical protein
MGTSYITVYDGYNHKEWLRAYRVTYGLRDWPSRSVWLVYTPSSEAD